MRQLIQNEQINNLKGEEKITRSNEQSFRDQEMRRSEKEGKDLIEFDALMESQRIQRAKEAEELKQKREMMKRNAEMNEEDGRINRMVLYERINWMNNEERRNRS